MRHITLLAVLFAVAPHTAMALTAYISVQVYPTCNYPSGTLYASGNGGVGPYTFLWNTGATTALLGPVPPGAYSVTVTDAVSAQATANYTLVGIPYALQDLGDSGPQGLCNANTGVAVAGPGYDPQYYTYLGPPPYTLDGATMWETVITEFGWPVDTMYTWFGITSQFGQYMTYAFEDGGGCTGTLSEYIGYPVEWPSLTILDISGACSGGSNGSITFQTGLEGHAQITQVKLETISSNYITSFGAGDAIYTSSYSSLPPGDYLLTQFMSMSEFLASSGCQVSTQFTIPDLGPGCGNINGRVILDNNEDCVWQGNEPGVPGVVLEILPGPSYALTSDYGGYSLNLPLGAYTLEQQSAVLEDHCVSAPAPFTLALGNALQTVNVLDTALVPMDASVSLASGAARPGFPMSVSALVSNLTLASTGASTLTLTFDPVLSFISASPAPVVLGNTLTWNVPAFSSFQQRHFHIELQVPPNINLLGTDLLFSATFTTGNADAVPANNNASLATTVTGSYDPNDKVATTSSGWSDDLYYIDVDDWIDYTIRFQNTGTDTAFNIVVTDTIAPELDLGTFVEGASSHAHALSIRDGNVLRWAFYNIQLPDSNVNEPASHGFVSFRIRPKQPQLPGTVIENTANIFFDFNDPVITDASVLTAEFSTGIQGQEQGQGQLLLLPNPVSDQLRISSDGTIEEITILAADGREVLRRAVHASNTSMDVSGLRNGTYFLVAILNDGSVVREHFIKL